MKQLEIHTERFGHQILVTRRCPEPGCNNTLGSWSRVGAKPKPIDCPCARPKEKRVQPVRGASK